MAAGRVNKVLTLLIRVQDAATAQLTQTDRLIKGFGGTVGNASSQLEKFGLRFAQVARALVSFLIMRTLTVQLVAFVKGMISANEITERITTSLANLGGSMAWAQKAMGFVRQLAIVTPFQIAGLASAAERLTAYGQDIFKWLPVLVDWASAFHISTNEIDSWAAAMGKILAQSPQLGRLLVTRGVSMRQWNEAMSQTNQEMSKEQRYAEALTIVLARFGGQAERLSHTFSGLKTNIADVWFEMSRQMGAEMFVKIHAAAGRLYATMVGIVKDAGPGLERIGEIFGIWTSRLILIVEKLVSATSHAGKLSTILEYIGVVILGRIITGQIVSIVTNMMALLKTVGGPIVIAVLAISFAVGRLAERWLKMKMAALDVLGVINDMKTAAEVMTDFWERTEKVLNDMEKTSLQMAIRDLDAWNDSLRATIDYLETVEDKTRGVFWNARAKTTMPLLDTAWVETMFKTMSEAGDKYFAVMGTDWADRFKAALASVGELKEFPGSKSANELIGLLKTILGLSLELRVKAGASIFISDEDVAKAEAMKVYLAAEADLMEQVKRLTRDYELNMAGVAGYEKNTAAYLAAQLRLIQTQLHDKENILTVAKQALALEKSITEEQEKQARLLLEQNEAYAKSIMDWLSRWKKQAEIANKTAIAQAGRDPHQIAAANDALAEQYRIIIENAMALRDMAKEWMPAEKIAELNLFIENVGLGLEQLTAKAEDFSNRLSGFYALEQALSPIVDAFSQIASGAADAAKAFGNAIKQMLAWAAKLILQLLIIAVLMSIFKLTGGGATGLTGAFMAMFGGGLAPKGAQQGAQHGFEGWVTQPRMFMVGEGGQPEYVSVSPQGRRRHGEGWTIHIHGDVYDSERFIRKVQEAQYQIGCRTGGGN